MPLYDQEYLQNLTRKELQALAKENGIKANKKSDDLIAELSAITNSEVANSTEDEPHVVQEEIEVVKVVEEEKREEPLALEVNSTVRALVDDVMCFATVKRINKKSLRVIMQDGSERTIPMDAFIEIVPSQSAETEGKRDIEIKDAETNPTRTPVEEMALTTQEDMQEEPSLAPMPVLSIETVEAPKVANRKRKAVKIAKETENVIIENALVITPVALPMPVAAVLNSPVAVDQEPVSSILSVDESLTTADSADAQIYASETDTIDMSTRTSTFNRRPTIVPKMTKTQRMRADAIAKKKQFIENISADDVSNRRFSTSMPTPAAPATAKQRKTSFLLPNHTPNKPAAQHIKQRVLTPHVAASKPPVTKSNVPDFKKMHAKAFNSSKSIADMVKKDTSLQSRMDSEISKAMAEIHRCDANENKSHNSVTVATASTTPFKSATNPFADVLSSVSKPSHAAWSNSFARRNATPANKCRKTVKNLFPKADIKKERNDKFVAGVHEKRKNAFKTSRIM